MLKLTAYILLAGLLTFISCKKEYSCEGCVNGNLPPIANAGPDQTINLPKDSVLLDGSASSDPDGNITSYKWIKVAGPGSANIVNPDSSKAKVKSLIAGVYQFELTVTDNGGLAAKDTIQVLINAAGNQPPVACAGADQTITLPTNSVTLNGSCSADPDNNITGYVWTKISGPSSFNMANSTTIQTHITGLTQGIYQFELKVTDAGGLTSKDTLQVTVDGAVVSITCGDTNRPHINVKLVEVGKLSQARWAMSAASAGNNILFAGGFASGNVLSSRVDLFDLNTQTWSTHELSEARFGAAAIAANNKIFFAGGEVSDGTFPTKAVDIYDVATKSWTVSALSIPGNGIAASTVGSKVLFGGGDPGFAGTWERTRRVDIYDLITGSWAVASLSTRRSNGHAAISVNNKVYFSGGESWPDIPVPGSWFSSNTVDIYDNTTNTWSVSSLTEGKMFHAGIAAGDKIFWAGGQTGGPPTTGSCSVEIHHLGTGAVTIQKLSYPGYRTAVVKNNQIVFYAGIDKFDIYDISTDTWSIGVLPFTPEGASIISVNNVVYLAGGRVNAVLSDKVWKLEF